jgi:hypothetical protein
MAYDSLSRVSATCWDGAVLRTGGRRTRAAEVDFSRQKSSSRRESRESLKGLSVPSLEEAEPVV